MAHLRLPRHELPSQQRVATFASAFLALTLSGCSASVSEDTQTIAEVQLAYSYEDNVPPAREITGLSAEKLPQFVAFTFDDNFYLDGVEWANSTFSSLSNPSGKGNPKTFDGTPARTTFYSNGTYADWDNIPAAWAASEAAGHEIANHTMDHPHGGPMTLGEWRTQITECENAFVSHSVVTSVDEVSGLRSPYLEYAENGFSALKLEGYTYDTSIQGCWGATEDGKNCYFPYTLNSGSPDGEELTTRFGEPPIGSHAGLWEVPVHALIVPPDSEAATYGFTAGLRGRIPANMPKPSYYDPATGKIAPLDFTLMVDAQMQPNEVLAILKYNFDLHLSGNRAPLVLVGHTHLFSASSNAAPGTPSERRAAIEEFLSYVLSKPETRVRPVRDIVAYLRAPVDLDGTPPEAASETGGTGGVASSGGGGGMPPSVASGGTSEEAEPAVASEVEPGCSCRMGTASAPSEPLAPLAALVLLAVVRERRRRDVA